MPEQAIIPQTGLPDVVIEVTDEEAELGVAEMECGACNGTGIVDWLPHRDEAPCIECSTRGTRMVMV